MWYDSRVELLSEEGDWPVRAEELGREVGEKEQEQIMHTNVIMKSICVYVSINYESSITKGKTVMDRCPVESYTGGSWLHQFAPCPVQSGRWWRRQGYTTTQLQCVHCFESLEHRQWQLLENWQSAKAPLTWSLERMWSPTCALENTWAVTYEATGTLITWSSAHKSWRLMVQPKSVQMSWAVTADVATPTL